MFWLSNYYMKLVGILLLLIPIVSIILAIMFHYSNIPQWLSQWLIVIGLTLVNFSKEKFENKYHEIIRTQSIYMASMTTLSLIISYTFVFGIFDLTYVLQPLIIAYIFNVIAFGSYYILLLLYKNDNTVITEKMQSAKVKISIFHYTLWVITITSGISFIFILFD